jgi:hypothetical protein
MRSSVPSGSKFASGNWRRLLSRWRPEPVTVFGGEEGFRTWRPGLDEETQALMQALVAAESDDAVPIAELINAAPDDVRFLAASRQRERLSSERGID